MRFFRESYVTCSQHCSLLWKSGHLGRIESSSETSYPCLKKWSCSLVASSDIHLGICLFVQGKTTEKP